MAERNRRKVFDGWVLKFPNGKYQGPFCEEVEHIEDASIHTSIKMLNRDRIVAKKIRWSFFTGSRVIVDTCENLLYKE
jgi:hypothetical protein